MPPKVRKPKTARPVADAVEPPSATQAVKVEPLAEVNIVDTLRAFVDYFASTQPPAPVLTAAEIEAAEIQQKREAVIKQITSPEHKAFLDSYGFECTARKVQPKYTLNDHPALAGYADRPYLVRWDELSHAYIVLLYGIDSHAFTRFAAGVNSLETQYREAPPFLNRISSGMQAFPTKWKAVVDALSAHPTTPFVPPTPTIDPNESVEAIIYRELICLYMFATYHGAYFRYRLYLHMAQHHTFVQASHARRLVHEPVRSLFSMIVERGARANPVLNQPTLFPFRQGSAGRMNMDIASGECITSLAAYQDRVEKYGRNGGVTYLSAEEIMQVYPDSDVDDSDMEMDKRHRRER